MSGDGGDSSGDDDMPQLLDKKSDGEGGLSDDGKPVPPRRGSLHDRRPSHRTHPNLGRLHRQRRKKCPTRTWLRPTASECWHNTESKAS